MRRPSPWLLLIAIVAMAPALVRADGSEPCQGGASAAVTAARAALAKTPGSLPTRFKLADALVEVGCFHDAVHTLEDGQSIHPRNAELQAKLRNARSFVNEQDYFEGKDQAERAAKLARHKLRCVRLGDMSACDEGLGLSPDDADLLLGKGDALLKAARPGEAEAAYRRAQDIAPDHVRIATALAAARAQRQPLLAKCESEADEAALQACQAALSLGGDDEPRIRTRIAFLSRPRSSPASALAASQLRAEAVAPAALAPIPQVAQTRTFSNAAQPSRSH